MALGASFAAAMSKPSALPKSRQMADRPDWIVKGALLSSICEIWSSTQAVGENQLMAVMFWFNEHRPETEADQEALRAFVFKVAQEAEQVTLRNAASTWKKFRIFC